MNDNIYFGITGRQPPEYIGKHSADPPCDWTKHLDVWLVIFYILDVNTVWMILKFAVRTFFAAPYLLTVQTNSDTLLKKHSGARRHTLPGDMAPLERDATANELWVAEIKLFWSTPKVKYTLHTVSWIGFLSLLAYYCVAGNPARTGDWGIGEPSEIYVYLCVPLQVLRVPLACFCGCI